MDENKVVAIISAPFLEEATSVNDAKWLMKHKDSLRRLIHSITAQKQGDFVSMLKGNFVIELDVDNLDALPEIEKQFKVISDKDLLIGVGDSLEDAEKALKYLVATDSVGIKVYQPDLEFHNENPIEDEFSDETDLYPEAELEGSTESTPNTFNIAARNSKNPSEPLLDPSGKGLTPPPTPQLAAPTPTSPEQEPAGELPDEIKQQVAATLQNIQQNKPIFDKVKVEAPEVYQQVVGVVASLAGIVKDMKHGQPVIQQLDHSNDINNALQSSGEDKAKEKAKKDEDNYKKHRERHKKRRELLNSNIEYNLLFNLLKKD